MTLIKKIDVPEHLAARRAMRRSGIRLVIQRGATGIPEVKTAGTKADAKDLVEDFAAEHTLSWSVPPSK